MALVVVALVAVNGASALAQVKEGVEGGDAGEVGSSGEFGAQAVVRGEVASGGGVEPTQAVTVVEMSQRVQAAGELKGVMREVPGVRAVSIGATGAFSTLSLRGADAQHTRVLWDTVRLDGAGGQGFDLSTVPLSLLDRVEVYRGATPTWLGGGGLGGALRLVPVTADGSSVGGPTLGGAVGVGSWGYRSVQAQAAAPSFLGGGWLTSAGWTRSEGDFRYTLDETPLTVGDGREVRRQNGDVLQVHGMVQGDQAVAGGRLRVSAWGVERTGGVPGPAIQPTLHTRRTRTRLMTSVGWSTLDAASVPPGEVDRERDQVEVQITGSSERHRFTDRFGEIGLGRQVTDDWTHTTQFRLAAKRWLGTESRSVERDGAVALQSVVVLDGGQEWFVPSDALAVADTGRSSRQRLGLGLETPVHVRLPREMLLMFRPSVRVEGVWSRLEGLAYGGGVGGADSEGVRTDQVWPTFRLAGLLAKSSQKSSKKTSKWSLTASTTTGRRAPTLTELFGDRGFLVGDAALSPERATGVDLGWIYQMERSRWSFREEVRGFAMWTEDLIRYVRTSQFQAVPQNVSRARSYGAEMGIRLAWRDRGGMGYRGSGSRGGERILWSGSWTWMRAEDLTLDRVLPLTPVLRGYRRLEGVVFRSPEGELRVYGDAFYLGANFADAANLVRLDARTRFGAGIAVDWRCLQGTVSVEDIADSRGQDIVGFPLPGRSVFVRVGVDGCGE